MSEEELVQVPRSIYEDMEKYVTYFIELEESVEMNTIKRLKDDKIRTRLIKNLQRKIAKLEEDNATLTSKLLEN